MYFDGEIESLRRRAHPSLFTVDRAPWNSSFTGWLVVTGSDIGSIGDAISADGTLRIRSGGIGQRACRPVVAARPRPRARPVRPARAAPNRTSFSSPLWTASRSPSAGADPPSRLWRDGGEGGIRTLGTLAGTRDFQSRTFDHSATSPEVGREPSLGSQGVKASA